MVALAVSALLNNSSRASTLFGGVTHSEVVPPVKTRYPLAPLSAEVPKQQEAEPTATSRSIQNPSVVWVPIPKWMAGKWTKQGDLTVSYTDLRTGATTPINRWTDDLTSVTWGNQIDGKGNIWHAYLVPWERDSVSDGKAVKFIIVEYRREATSTEQVVSRVHSIVTERLGEEIVSAFQQESLNDYSLLPSGELENHSSNRDYTNEGQPIREGVLVSRYTKVGSFVAVASLGGIDLVESLNAYLVGHNMLQLVRHNH